MSMAYCTSYNYCRTVTNCNEIEQKKRRIETSVLEHSQLLPKLTSQLSWGFSLPIFGAWHMKVNVGLFCWVL